MAKDELRVIAQYEQRQRGCQYCIDVTTKLYEGQRRTACPFQQCPYTVLDKYKSFEEFMESEDGKIPVTEYFSTVPAVYELSTFPHAPRGIFRDNGDFKMHL